MDPEHIELMSLRQRELLPIGLTRSASLVSLLLVGGLLIYRVAIHKVVPGDLLLEHPRMDKGYYPSEMTAQIRTWIACGVLAILIGLASGFVRRRHYIRLMYLCVLLGVVSFCAQIRAQLTWPDQPDLLWAVAKGLGIPEFFGGLPFAGLVGLILNRKRTDRLPDAAPAFD
jgi:hypothetical protein